MPIDHLVHALGTHFRTVTVEDGSEFSRYGGSDVPAN